MPLHGLRWQRPTSTTPAGKPHLRVARRALASAGSPNGRNLNGMGNEVGAPLSPRPLESPRGRAQ
eukprot:11200186-Lingulodinium_polyedra.AAC.1